MAKILKCPRCQEKIDVTDLSGGSTVKCEACGTMVRLATGGTQPVPKAAAAPPAPAAPAKKERSTRVRAGGGGGAAAGGRQTDLFRKMSNARAPGEKGGGRREKGESGGGGMKPGVMIAIAAGVLIVIGGVAFALMGKKEPASTKATSGESSGGTKKKKDKKDEPKKFTPAPIVPSDTGVFKPGALAMIDKASTPMMSVNPEVNAQYELLAGAGKASEIVAQDYRWVTYVINGMLSDNEGVAKGSMDAMHQIIVKRKLEASQSDLARQANIGGFNMPEMRSGEYTYWAQWWFTASARNAVASWKEAAGDTGSAGGGAAGIPGGNAATEPWEETLKRCRSGGFANQTTPEYYEYQKIKGMGKSAYPHLIKYIDHADFELGKTAVLILNELTGRGTTTRVNDGNKATIKADWEAWLKTQ